MTLSSFELAGEVVDYVTSQDRGVSASELASVLGATRATTYRVLESLVRREFLERSPEMSGFLPGARLVEIARRISLHAPEPPAQIIERLRGETGAAIHLIGFRDGCLELLDEDCQYPVPDRERFLTELHRSAAGQLLLLERGADAGAPSAEVALLAEATATRGYAQQIGLLAPDSACLAVPVRVGRRCVGALALADRPGGISAAARHVPRLRDAAVRVAVAF